MELDPNIISFALENRQKNFYSSDCGFGFEIASHCQEGQYRFHYFIRLCSNCGRVFGTFGWICLGYHLSSSLDIDPASLRGKDLGQRSLKGDFAGQGRCSGVWIDNGMEAVGNFGCGHLRRLIGARGHASTLLWSFLFQSCILQSERNVSVFLWNVMFLHMLQPVVLSMRLKRIYQMPLVNMAMYAHIGSILQCSIFFYLNVCKYRVILSIVVIGMWLKCYALPLSSLNPFYSLPVLTHLMILQFLHKCFDFWRCLVWLRWELNPNHGTCWNIEASAWITWNVIKALKVLVLF